MSWANAGCNLGDVVWVWKYQNSQNKVFEITAIGKIDPAGHSAAEAEPSKPFVNALASTLGGPGASFAISAFRATLLLVTGFPFIEHFPHARRQPGHLVRVSVCPPRAL